MKVAGQFSGCGSRRALRAVVRREPVPGSFAVCPPPEGCHRARSPSPNPGPDRGSSQRKRPGTAVSGPAPRCKSTSPHANESRSSVNAPTCVRRADHASGDLRPVVDIAPVIDDGVRSEDGARSDKDARPDPTRTQLACVLGNLRTQADEDAGRDPAHAHLIFPRKGGSCRMPRRCPREPSSIAVIWALASGPASAPNRPWTWRILTSSKHRPGIMQPACPVAAHQAVVPKRARLRSGRAGGVGSAASMPAALR